MARNTMSTQTQQMLGILLPLAALAISLGVAYPTWNHYQQTSASLTQRKNELAALRSAPLPEAGAVQPAADDVEGESSEFFGEVTRRAAAAGCEVTGLDVVGVADTKAAGVARPKRAKLVITGRYSQVRSFLEALARADRVYVVTDLAMQSKDANAKDSTVAPLTATLTIERYVAAPGFLAAAPQ